ncbi:MAG: hypothetical protein HQK67_07030 [Desulfamplus sp.]|nr:hypothetical protein [Desulfamplus sp.]
MEHSIYKLSPQVRIYLKRVAELGDLTPWGIYASKKTWIPLWLVTGLLMVAGPLFALIFYRDLMVLSATLPLPGYFSDFWWLLVSTTLGALIAVSAWHTLRVRRDPNFYIGEFSFTDPEWHWCVSAHKVLATRIAGLNSIQAVEHSTNGSYQSTRISYTINGTRDVLIFDNRDLGSSVANYLMGVEALQDSGETALTGILLGCVAKTPSGSLKPAMELLNGSECIPSQLDMVGKFSIQTITKIPRIVLQFLSLAVAAIFAWFVIPYIGFFIMDETLYGEAKSWMANKAHLQEMGTSSLNYYLNKVGDRGGHIPEIQSLLDDASFEVAEEALKSSGVSALREYLSNTMFTHHREKGQYLINKEYDQAIAKLHEGEPSSEEEGLAGLADGLIVLLSSLKNAGSPNVVVNFKPTIQIFPRAESEKFMEKMVYEKRLSDNDTLKSIAQSSVSKSAIIDPGESFSDFQVGRREKVIRERLADALRKILRADLITLITEHTGNHTADTPSLEVTYHVYPNGGLYLYTFTTDTMTEDSLSSQSSEKIKGLLRGYMIDWTIVIKSINLIPEVTYSLTSNPMSQLRMSSDTTDPYWAAYAVIQYSAFYDFSDRLIRAFGLEPQPKPEVFKFNEM